MREEREREVEIWEKRLWGDVGPERGIKYIKLILQPVPVRTWMYQLTIAGLQIFLDIAT